MPSTSIPGQAAGSAGCPDPAARGQDAAEEPHAGAAAAAGGEGAGAGALYEEIRRRHRWLEEGMAASSSLLAEDSSSPEGDLEVVAQHALRAAVAVLAVIASPAGGTLQVLAPAGALLLTPAEGVPTPGGLRALQGRGQPAVLDDPAQLFGSAAARKLGQVLSFPLGPGRAGERLVLLARPAGSGPFTEADLASGAGYGSHVGLALDLGLVQRRREDALLSTDRDRIAAGLNDLVIRRLFAAGMSMQNLGRAAPDPAIRAGIATLTGELDATIRELRSTVYSLRQGPRGQGLAHALVDAVHDAVRGTGLVPRVSVDGIIGELPPALARGILAIGREAIGDAIARSAAELTVTLTAIDGVLALTVEDDGTAATADQDRRAARLVEHAAALGGTASTEGVPGGGTRVTSTVPRR
ncbi:signal transduction histidine kinase [Sinomonas atrocyanea]|uniref:sensor histidine kinase n=1 Tax=Sinomonas atrocyanea TaxID=37927 RepID=UPI002788AF7C|nr:histidine kinase [Sinomonas atrocyanea]MDP9885653.1 signal transduction histidine kinase [Sinomonas atrocyanea]